MRWAYAATVVTLALVGCGGGSGQHARVLTMASADPLGIEHDPAVKYFADRVAKLSNGRLRIAVDERWAHAATAHEADLLRDVAHGRADLGWAHASSFDRVGVDSFQALQAPMLIDRDSVQDAVIRSALATRMLTGTRRAGLEGLALLAGPLSRLVGVNRPLGDGGELRGVLIAVHDSALTDAAVHALHSYPRTITAAQTALFYVDVGGDAGPPAGMEDDLDALFFDRYGGPCHSPGAACARVGPWLATNAALWPRAAVLVANPRRLRGLGARERAWVTEAATQAATYSTTRDDDARVLPELCAAGVRMTTASDRTLVRLRAAWRPIYRQLESRPDARAAVREIRRLRAAAPTRVPLQPLSACSRRSPAGDAALGVRSTVPDGVYRVRVTNRDLRAAGANRASDRAGTATLTLRDGRWRLVFTEPGHSVSTGTYAGTALRTAWATDGRTRDEAYLSIVVRRDGALAFRVGSADDLASTQAIYASHPWQRIGP
jgi:TRAP-type C4-dicarboxylate transport system substrate-binding protein